MDFVSPIFSIATDLLDCTAKCSSRTRNLRENLECLRKEMDVLNRRNHDVKVRVELAEEQHMKPRSELEGWLRDVDQEGIEVNAILCEGDKLLKKKWLQRYCNFRSSYKFGKKVNRKIMRLYELGSRDFEVVADKLTRAAVDELPLTTTVGLDSLYDKVCRCLSDAQVGIVGLYGARGVGKTTLMKKINNGLLETSHDFDTVIWVEVSGKAGLTAAREMIGNKLQISDSMWKNRNQYEKAIKIFNVMKTKRFLLLLDNVQQWLDFLDIGVPLPEVGSGSKVIITSRSRRLCYDMQAQETFEVEPLAWEEAWTLFSRTVGETTISSHPQIQQLAHTYTEKCKGLPSALIKVGQHLARRNSEHWELDKDFMDDIIEREISGMDD